MAHPVYKVDGKRVPSTTTVLGRFKESGGLIHWAYQRGLEGAEHLYERDQAAASGTLAHNMIEAKLLGNEIEIPPDATPAVVAQAEKGYKAWELWSSQSSLDILATETSMVSKVHGFGGTPDAVGYVNGELCMLDWKTSNGIYLDYCLQVASYVILWDENNPDSVIQGGLHVCRFSKEHADFEHRHFGEIEDFKAQFLRLLEAYKHDKELKKRVR